uniref:RNA-dependent RNA polymerase n=1 Tax=Hubei reo-like virus 4 TaxID=1923179 RepID=A0A1L3KP80_9VIRU|nr:RNA-dependent RNA polymerase [Hubei reo-like virus 4]
MLSLSDVESLLNLPDQYVMKMKQKRNDFKEMVNDITDLENEADANYTSEHFSPRPYEIGTYRLLDDGTAGHPDRKATYPVPVDVYWLQNSDINKTAINPGKSLIQMADERIASMKKEIEVMRDITTKGIEQVRWHGWIRVVYALGMVLKDRVETGKDEKICSYGYKHLQAILQQYGDAPFIEGANGIIALRRVSATMIQNVYQFMNLTIDEITDQRRSDFNRIIAKYYTKWELTPMQDTMLKLKDLGETALLRKLLISGISGKVPIWTPEGELIGWTKNKNRSCKELSWIEDKWKELVTDNVDEDFKKDVLHIFNSTDNTFPGLFEMYNTLTRLTNGGLYYKTNPVIGAEKAVTPKTLTVIGRPKPSLLDPVTRQPIDYKWETSPVQGITDSYKFYNDVLKNEAKHHINLSNPMLQFRDALKNTSSGLNPFSSIKVRGEEITKKSRSRPIEGRAKKDIKFKDTLKARVEYNQEEDQGITRYLNNIRTLLYAKTAHLYDVRDEWLKLYLQPNAAGVRTQIDRRLRVIVNVSPDHQIVWLVPLLAYNAIKKVDLGSALGKQYGNMLDMIKNLYTTSTDGWFNFFGDISGMDASLQDHIQEYTYSVLVNFLSESQCPKYFFAREGVYSYIRASDGCEVTIPENALSRFFHEIFNLVKPLEYMIIDQVFGINTRSGGTFPSGQFNTSLNHTFLGSTIAQGAAKWLEENMSMNFQYIKVSVLGDDIAIAVRVNAEERAKLLFQRVIDNYGSCGLKLDNTYAKVYATFLQQTALNGRIFPKPARLSMMTVERSSEYARKSPAEKSQALNSLLDDLVYRVVNPTYLPRFQLAMWVMCFSTERLHITRELSEMMANPRLKKYIDVTKTEENTIARLYYPLIFAYLRQGGGCAPPPDKPQSPKLGPFYIRGTWDKIYFARLLCDEVMIVDPENIYPFDGRWLKWSDEKFLQTGMDVAMAIQQVSRSEEISRQRVSRIKVKDYQELIDGLDRHVSTFALEDSRRAFFTLITSGYDIPKSIVYAEKSANLIASAMTLITTREGAFERMTISGDIMKKIIDAVGDYKKQKAKFIKKHYPWPRNTLTSKRMEKEDFITPYFNVNISMLGEEYAQVCSTLLADAQDLNQCQEEWIPFHKQEVYKVVTNLTSRPRARDSPLSKIGMSDSPFLTSAESETTPQTLEAAKRIIKAPPEIQSAFQRAIGMSWKQWTRIKRYLLSENIRPTLDINREFSPRRHFIFEFDYIQMGRLRSWWMINQVTHIKLKDENKVSRHKKTHQFKMASAIPVFNGFSRILVNDAILSLMHPLGFTPDQFARVVINHPAGDQILEA